MLGSVKTEGNSNYYFIEKQLGEPPTDSIRSKVLKSLDKPDMSNPETLKKFIEYGVEHYPADHYMLIINDHGSGWRGVCSDSFSQDGEGEMMTLPELSSHALALPDYKFDIIVFNAPSMSMVEVAYQLKDRAEYLVASQYRDFKRNILGFPIWLKDLTNNPNISIESLASNIATAIHTTAGSLIGISAIDLSKIDALTSKIADFGRLLVSRIGDYQSQVVDARGNLGDFPHFPTYYFDLRTFCQNIQDSTNLDSAIKGAARAVENANDMAVIKRLNYPNLDYGGLCIHFPLESEDFDSTDYVQLAFTVSNWHIFLSEYIKAYAEVNLFGSLRIVSSPVKGAWIFLDGDSTGLKTDTTIHGIPEGEHRVKLTKEGYWDREYRAYVFAGDTTEYKFGFGYEGFPLIEEAYLDYR
ncbi:MAG: clostripain-related cysteine peptidase [Candidatus Zixiibacteriota bacterium]